MASLFLGFAGSQPVFAKTVQGERKIRGKSVRVYLVYPEPQPVLCKVRYFPRQRKQNQGGFSHFRLFLGNPVRYLRKSQAKPVLHSVKAEKPRLDFRENIRIFA